MDEGVLLCIHYLLCTFSDKYSFVRKFRMALVWIRLTFSCFGIFLLNEAHNVIGGSDTVECPRLET